jgi:hypothetical protein
MAVMKAGWRVDCLAAMKVAMMVATMAVMMAVKMVD